MLTKDLPNLLKASDNLLHQETLRNYIKITISSKSTPIASMKCPNSEATLSLILRPLYH